VIGVGLYEVNAVGVMTFTPEPSYVGTPAPLPYIVSDNVTQIAASTYTPTVVVPGPPVAMPDITSGAQGQEQSISLLTNDSAATGAVLSATSVRLCGSGEISPACTQTSVIVPGVGTYTVGSTGTITFSPEPQYVGTPTALPYIVRDHIGQVAASTYTPKVVAPPTPPSSTSSVPQGAPRLAITTTPSRVVLRLGQTSVITLRVTNSGTATAKKTVTRALIPDNFVVVKTNGGRVVGRYIIFATGDLPPRRGATRTFVVRPTAAAIGHTAPVVGRSVGTNVKRVTDPTALRVVGPRPHRAPVTG
jgi:CshA-type fibril repeat protein